MSKVIEQLRLQQSADITQVHKRDLPEPAENCRPISLLPIMSKVMERC